MSAQHTPMELKAGRALSDISAKECCIDVDDQWKEFGQFWIADAASMLKECGATGLLEALRAIAAITTCADQDPEAMCAEIQGICRKALAKVTGGAA